MIGSLVHGKGLDPVMRGMCPRRPRNRKSRQTEDDSVDQRDKGGQSNNGVASLGTVLNDGTFLLDLVDVEL